jgi:quercetin dioxygenase-like cupin family protein
VKPFARLCFAALAAGLCAPAGAAPVFENAYVTVTRDAAPCAKPAAACRDRVVVAMGDVELRSEGKVRRMKRGEVAVFKAGDAYEPPAGAPYYEVAVKPDHPPVRSPAELIPPPKNTIVHDGERFFVYEERLAVGDTRARHSHSQRIEIRVNQGPALRQIIEGRDAPQEPPPVVNFREPVIHTVTNVGDMPLWNFILEFKPEPAARAR